MKSMTVLMMAVVSLTTLGVRAQDEGEGAARGRRGPRHGLPPGLRERLLEAFDADGDGKLTGAERDKARESMKKRRAARHKKILETFDADGDGELNAEERKEAIEEMHKRYRARRKEGQAGKDNDGEGEKDGNQAAPKMPEALKAQILDAFDVDGDGALSRREFAPIHRAFKPEGGRHRKMPEALKKKLLEAFDADGDGELNQEEHAKARREHMKHREGRPGRGRGPKGDAADKDAPEAVGDWVL